jgi:predicted nucleic acid-binding protein
MMQVCVVDCSFFISCLLPDESNKDFDFSAFSVYVPSVFFLECLNVLETALKKQRITKNQYEECIKSFKDLPFYVDYFSSVQGSLYVISLLSQKYNLTSYDASYLELASRLKSPLGTLDKKIIEACKIEKIRLL